MDILLPLGNGSKFGNLELRFALRSIEKFASGYHRVFVVGLDPGFLSENVTFVPVNEMHGNKEARIYLKVLWTFQNTDISDDAAFWNDDYVLTKPTNVSAIDFFQRGDLLATAKKAKCSIYHAALINTAAKLSSAGKPTWHYDIHVPMILNRQKFLSLSDWWHGGKDGPGLTMKSIYANNVLGIPGPFMSDLKIRQFNLEQARAIAAERWVLSYSDRAMNTGIADFLEKMFPHKSRFEA